MRLQHLRVHNFGSVEDAEVPLDEQGLVLLEGENLDAGGSNGSGKTTLVPDAISWCLFGVTTKGLKADEVVRVSAAPNDGTEVQLSFELGGRNITIARYRKHATAGNRIMLIVDGEDRTPATAKLTEDAIVEMLGTTQQVWQYAVILGQGLAFRFSQLSDGERERLLEDIVQAQVYDEARQRAQKRERALAEQAAGLRGMIASGEAQLASTQESFKQAGLRVQSESAAWEVRRVRLEEHLGGLTQQLNEAEAARAQAQAALSEFDKAFVEMQRQLDAAAREAANLDGQCRTRLAAISTAERQQSSWDSVADCPTCRQPITAEYREHYRQSVEADLASQRTIVEALKQQVKAAQDAEQRLRVAQQQRAEKRSGLSATVGRLVAAAAEVGSSLRVVQHELQTGGTFPTATLVEHLRADISNQEAALAESARSLKDIESSAELVRFWVTGFADIRRARIAEMVRLVNQRLAYYLSEVSGNALSAEILVSEKNTAAGVATKFMLSIKGPGGSYRSASGGEKDRVDVAIAFALHDLVMASAGFSVNVLVADELCPAVDARGIEGVVTTLRAKLASVGSIFVMAHHDGWKRLMDSVWTVQKSGGVTRLIRKGARSMEHAGEASGQASS